MPAGQTGKVLPSIAFDSAAVPNGAPSEPPAIAPRGPCLGSATAVLACVIALTLAPLHAHAAQPTGFDPVDLRPASVVTMSSPVPAAAVIRAAATSATETTGSTEDSTTADVTADTTADTGFDSAAIDPAVAEPGDVLQRGVASWYGRAWKGRRTASGTRFNPEAMTAASHTLPLGTRVWVTIEGTARSVLVTITDRQGSARRVIDLSLAAARKIGMLGIGTARVVLRRA